MKANIAEPILSICIPTFNRARFLDELLQQLAELHPATQSRIVVCISDNASTDNTPCVIKKWKAHLSLRVVRQSENIGGSRNFQAVAALADTPWMVLMGDDDLLSVEGFNKLIRTLDTIESNTWVFANIRNQDGSRLIKNLSNGPYHKLRFKLDLLMTTLLDSLGFMSAHVIPQVSYKYFITCDTRLIYAWPHLGLLFQQLSNINLYFFDPCIVLRGGAHGEVTQTWRPNDWLCLMMQKSRLCATRHSLFSNLLTIAQYFRWPYVRQTLFTMLVDGNPSQVFSQAAQYIDSTNLFALTKLVLKIQIFFLTSTPVSLIRTFRLVARRSFGRSSIPTCSTNTHTDGVDRGL